MPLTLEDYFRTTYEDNMLEKLPQSRTAAEFHTSAFHVLDVGRQVDEVHEALRSYKEEFRLKMDAAKLRREELERKQVLLRKNLEKFEKFLTENDSKRLRALKKASLERDMIRRKNTELINLQSETDQLILYRDRLKKDLAAHSAYNNYMTKVIETTDEYREIREIMTRYDTLTAVHQELLARQQFDSDAMETLRNNHKLYVAEMEEKTMSDTLQLSELQMRLEKALSNVVAMDAKWTEISSSATFRTYLIGSIILSVDNMYELVQAYIGQRNTRRMKDTEEPLDTAGKLDEVKDLILELSDIATSLKGTVKITPPCA